MPWLRIIVVMLLASGLLMGAQALASVDPVVKGQITGDFARVTFAWPERVRMSPSTAGKSITLKFDRPSQAEVEKIVQSLYPFITSAERLSDGKSYRFTLEKAYRTRTFLSGNTTGIDILGIDAKRRTAPPKTLSEKKPEAAKLATLAPAAGSAEVKKPEPVAAAKPAKKPIELAARIQPLEPAKPADIPKPAETPKPEAAKPATETKPLAQAPPANPAPTPARHAESKSAIQAVPHPGVPLAAKPETTTQPVATAAPAAVVAAKPATPVPATAEPPIVVPDNPHLRFPWNERVAAAVFVREGVLWVVFNKKMPFTLDSIRAAMPPLLTSVTELSHPQATVLRFTSSAPVFPVVSKPGGSYEWLITFNPQITRPQERIKVKPSTDPPLKPHVLLNVLETADSLLLEDPLIKDKISVTPIYRPGVGLMPARRFVEFLLPITAQGLVVIPRSGETRIAGQRGGIKITQPGDGISLSKDIQPLAMDEAADALAGGATLFPYEKWKLKDPKHFAQEKQRFQNQIAQGPKENSNYARLKLLQLYLSEGWFAEALGVAQNIRASDMDFYTAEKVSAYEGVANFMLYRMNEASRLFASPELADVPEMLLWRDLTDELFGDPTKHFNFMTYNDAYLKKYPPAMRQKLAIIGADLAIASQDFNTALKIFDTLNVDKIIAPIQKYVDFLIGKVSAETGQTKTAVQLWEQLSQEYDDNFIRARAEFSLVNLLLSQGKITKEEAMQRLDRLRIVWRGDGLELNLLSLLGTLYLEDKKYAESLRAYRDIVNYFPNVPEAIPTAQKMSETFVYLFNEGGADKMPPLEALALYYEFRELTPIDVAGDKMIRNLADRLASVDLLDRAAALLDHQVRFRLQGEDRSRVGARLALIYLLNHQPLNAIRTLETTGYGQNPIDLRETRSHLGAHAYLEMGDPDSALQVLTGDNTPEAMQLKLLSYWNKRDWKQVISLSENMLSEREDPSKPLNEGEAEALIKLATAYVYQRDIPQLQYLRDYFTPLLQGSPQLETFSFITGGAEPVDYQNLPALTQELSSIENYLSSYRTKIQTEGLSQAIQ